MLWVADVCCRAAFLLLSLGRFPRSYWTGFSQTKSEFKRNRPHVRRAHGFARAASLMGAGKPQAPTLEKSGWARPTLEILAMV